jgi:uncharacterized membrane protein
MDLRIRWNLNFLCVIITFTPVEKIWNYRHKWLEHVQQIDNRIPEAEMN